MRIGARMEEGGWEGEEKEMIGKDGTLRSLGLIAKAMRCVG